jgi:N-acetylglutamate synthase-like GNAT family acetyltransferase
MKIEKLKFHPELVRLLAHLMHREFGQYFPEETEAELEHVFQNRLNENCLPITYVALENGQFVGTFSLRESDSKLANKFSPALQKNYSPWVGSVYVIPEKRKRGIGKILMERAKQETKKLGYRHLYLFTTHAEEWYCALGFHTIEKTFLGKHPVAIMECLLRRSGKTALESV